MILAAELVRLDTHGHPDFAAVAARLGGHRHAAPDHQAAHARNPERFVHKPPVPPDLPTAAWINKPKGGRCSINSNAKCLTELDRVRWAKAIVRRTADRA